MLSLVLAILMTTATASTPAEDLTARLLSELRQCDLATIAQTGPRLDLLLALADGRSGIEIADILNASRACLGRASSLGSGADEVVFIGAASPFASARGAVLWVDRGYWRIASAPLGYAPGPIAPTVHADGREYLIAINSGGSAGTIGLAAVLISGATARTTLSFAPRAEIRGSRLLSDGRLLVEGRATGDRALTWWSHAGWPGGAQWLFERRADGWVLVAERQTVHPYLLLMGLVGGLRDGDAATMSRFASGDVVAQALALPPPGRGLVALYATYADNVVDSELARREAGSWDALPDDERVALGSAHLVRTITWGPGSPLFGVQFDRDASGWRITSIGLVPAGPDIHLVP